MKDREKTGLLEFEYEDSNLGVFVKSIIGLENANKANFYWILYINNELSPVGVIYYTPKNEDIVEWHFIDTNEIY